MRQIGEAAPIDEMIDIAAADPVRQYGVMTDESLVPATHTNVQVLRDWWLVDVGQSAEYAVHAELSRTVRLEWYQRPPTSAA